MKKKICYFVLIFIMVFMLTGCKNGETTRGIRHAGFTLSSTEFNCSAFMPKDETDTSYAKIWYYNGTKLITENGLIYEVALGGEFTNGESCKQADFTRRVTAILDDKIIRADDGRLYYLVANGNAAAYTAVTTEDSSYSLYQILFKDPETTKIITVDQNAGIYYLLKRDGNVYKYVISKSDYNQPPTLVDSPIVYSKGTYGVILDFNYSLSSIGGNFIRSNTAIHRNIATNYEQCSKYADVQCHYEMRQDIDLYQYMDKIIVYNGSTIITTYGAVFGLS